MSDTGGISWYINMSPFNRYLAYDILRTVGISALIVGTIQFLPVPIEVKDFSIDIGGVLLIIYLFRQLLKQFSSFSGISIRFILDEEGATMMEDHDASGLKYVAQQVSTMRWDPMHAGSFRASNIKPRVPRLEWINVSKISESPKRNLVILHGDRGGFMRLFCNEENYSDVLAYVSQRMNAKRYV